MCTKTASESGANCLISIKNEECLPIHHQNIEHVEETKIKQDKYSSMMWYQSQSNHPKVDDDDPLIVLGVNLSPLHPKLQFYICAGGVFAFTIVYGYLQELLTVQIMGREYALFLSLCQLAGYAFWSSILMNIGKYRQNEIRNVKETKAKNEDMLIDDYDKGDEVEKGQHQTLILDNDNDNDEGYIGSEERNVIGKSMSYASSNANEEGDIGSEERSLIGKSMSYTSSHEDTSLDSDMGPPFHVYILLSLMKAFDIGLTNGAMKFLNYPAKTLIKSSRVAFTMLTGVLIGRKSYRMLDYVMVSLLVLGLSIFLHADHRSKAIFHPVGVFMLMLSLCCDGLFNNYSELIMKKHRISQDQYQSSIYSVAFVILLIVTIATGEFIPGFQKTFIQHGTIAEVGEDKIGLYHHHREYPTYTRNTKLLVFIFFTLTGLLGSSCAGAITKRFGALKMSITSTTRKAATLFLSLANPGFENKCTFEHILGMIIFIGALFFKSLYQHKKSRFVKESDETELLHNRMFTSSSS